MCATPLPLAIGKYGCDSTTGNKRAVDEVDGNRQSDIQQESDVWQSDKKEEGQDGAR